MTDQEFQDAIKNGGLTYRRLAEMVREARTRDSKILRVLENLRGEHEKRIREADILQAHWSHRNSLDAQRVGIEQAYEAVKRVLEAP